MFIDYPFLWDFIIYFDCAYLDITNFSVEYEIWNIVYLRICKFDMMDISSQNII